MADKTLYAYDTVTESGVAALAPDVYVLIFTETGTKKVALSEFLKYLSRLALSSDVSRTIVGPGTTDTLTGKTIDADGSGNSITNIDNSNIKAGAAIDPTKISTGSLTATKWGYLSGITSNIQDQLTNKADATDIPKNGSLNHGYISDTASASTWQIFHSELQAAILGATSEDWTQVIIPESFQVSLYDETSKTYISPTTFGLDIDTHGTTNYVKNITFTVTSGHDYIASFTCITVDAT